MTTYYVKASGGNDANDGLSLANAKTLAGALSIATSEDIILLDNGRYNGFTITNKSNITLQARNARTLVTPTGWTEPHPAIATRHVTIEGCWLVNSPNITFKDIAFTCPFWIDVTDGTHKDETTAWIANQATAQGKTWPGNNIVNWDATSHSPVFDGCESYWGYGPTQTPFDVTADYPEYQSGAWTNNSHSTLGRGDDYQSWWKDDNDVTGGTPNKNTGLLTTPNGRAFNTLANGPQAFASTNGGSSGATYVACHIHDVVRGIVAQINEQKTVVDQCWFERIYTDSIFTATDNLTINANSGIQVTRNIFEHSFGNSTDSGNPHCDIVQHFNGFVNSTPANPTKLRNYRFERNIFIARPSARAGAQYLFLQGPVGHGGPTLDVNYTGAIIRNNIGLQWGSDKGLRLVYAEDCYVTDNMFVAAPGSSYSNKATISLPINRTTGYGGVNLIKDNIVDSLSSLSSYELDNNMTVGGWSTIPYSTVLAGSFPPAQDTAKGWFQAAQRKPQYASHGPRYSTIESQILDPLTTEDMLPFVGFLSKQAVGLGLTQTSNPSLVRGPEGDTVEVSVAIGEFKVTDQSGATVTDWTSTPTNVDVGDYLQVRHTSSNTNSTTVNQAVTLTHDTLGETVYSFKSSTLSDIKFPTVNLPNGVTPQYTGALGTPSTKLTFAVRWKPTTTVTGSGYYLFGSTNSREPIRVRAVGTGIIRANAYTDAGTNALSGNIDSVGDLGLVKTRLLILSIDTATGGEGVSGKVYDVSDWTDHRAISAVSIAQWDQLLDTTDTTGASALRSINHGVDGSQPNIDFVFLKMGEWLDATNPDAVNSFVAENLGPQGQGVFGSIPEVFTVGNAAAWNSGSGLNLGTAGKFIIPSGATTNVDDQPWPPRLTVSSEVISDGAAIQGQPVTIKLSPQGYSQEFNLTCNANDGVWEEAALVFPEGRDGLEVTFTPTKPGNYTLSFTNDVNYTVEDITFRVYPVVTDLVKHWLDKNSAVGSDVIHLDDILEPYAPYMMETSPTIDAITSISMVSGANSYFAFDAGNMTLDVTSAGISAGFPEGKYNFRFEVFYENKQSRLCDLQVVVTNHVRYVDGISGNDSNNGLTKGAAWKHIPGDVNATGNSAAYASPSNETTLISILGGQRYRSTAPFVAKARCVYYGDTESWNIAAPEVTTMQPLTGGVSVTQADVFGNPNYAAIVKFEGVNLDRSCTISTFYDYNEGYSPNPELYLPAQFPPPGVDLITHRQLPVLPNGEGGMRQLSSSLVTTISSKIYELTWAELTTEFPGIDFNGCTLWVWAGANHIIPADITAYNTSTGKITFAFLTDTPPLLTYGYTAVNITGHPALISGTKQSCIHGGNLYICKAGDFDQYQYAASQSVINVGVADEGAIVSLVIQGGFSSKADTNGGGIFLPSAESTNLNGFDIWYNRVGLCISDSSAIASIRTSGSYINNNWTIGRNIFDNSYRASGVRLSTNGNNSHYIYDNYFNKLNFTSLYTANATNLVATGNIIENGMSTHGNGISLYDVGANFKCSTTSGSNVITLADGTSTATLTVGRWVRIVGAGLDSADLYTRINNKSGLALTLDVAPQVTASNVDISNAVSYNNVIDRAWVRNTTRPFTLQAPSHTTISNSLFEMDRLTQEASALWSDAKELTIERSVFTHAANIANRNSTDALYTRGVGVVANSVVDGSTTGVNRFEYKNNLFTYVSGNEPSPRPWSNVGLDSGNKFQALDVWDGTIPSTWMRTLGIGAIGPFAYVSDLSQLVFNTQLDVTSNAEVLSNWAELITDSPARTITVSGGIEYRVADDASGTNATAWTSTPTSVDAGKYIQLRRTTSVSSYETEIGSVDQGGGMVDTWTTRTIRVSDLPSVRLGGTLRTTTQVAFNDTNSTVFTAAILGLKRGATAWDNGGLLFGQYSGSPLSWAAQTTPNRIRFLVRNASNTNIAIFQTPILAEGVAYDILISLDVTKATLSEALQLYINGVNETANVYQPTYVTGQEIILTNSAYWAVTQNQTDSEFGALFAHPAWIDLSVAANREKFTSLQLGDKASRGESVFGVVPKLFYVGNADDWNNANGTTVGPQRGSLPQLSNINALTVTQPPSVATSWPAYDYATEVSIVAPESTYTGLTTPIQLQTDGAIGIPRQVTIVEDSSGTFDPASPITIPASIEAQDIDVDYLPTTSGARTVTVALSPPEDGLEGSTKEISVGGHVATAYTVSGPASVLAGVPTQYTITLNGVNVSGVSIDIAVGGVAATISETPITLVAGVVTIDFTVTFDAGGTAIISASNDSELINPSNKTVVVLDLAVINPGQTATLTKAQAKTLRFITDDEPVGNNKGHAVVTWNRNSGNSGVVDTLDIKGNVVGNYVSISVDVEQIGVSDFILDTTSIPDGNLVTVTVPLDTPSITYS